MNRLHETLLTISPALEKALDLTNQGPLILLTGYQTPATIGQLGVTELTEWLRARKVRRAGELATRAVAAANAQRIALPGEALAAHLAAQLAEGVIALDEQIKHTDKLIEGRFHRHHAAPVILSMPGIGFLLGAEFLAATGGDTAAFATPIAWPATPVWPPPLGTPVVSAATSTDPSATTGNSSASSTPPR